MPFPRMFRLRQKFDCPRLDDIPDEVDHDHACQVPVDLQPDGKSPLGHQPVGRERLPPALAHRLKRNDEAVALEILDDVRNRLLGELARPRQVGTRKRAVEPQRLDHDAAIVRTGPFLVSAALGADRADVVHLRFPLDSIKGLHD